MAFDKKAYMKAYKKSDKYKAYQKAYQKSDKYKACKKAYQKSDKYKTRRDNHACAKEYLYLLGLKNRTQQQTIRLYALAELLGRGQNEEEWMTQKEKERKMEVM